ncbi:alpha/beta fold hydrolase [Actinoplanes sp. G11-F43]|uniref:alpha/beta fold hydrolase n=1 Tax=Actinoplanes sp. G11-F43 TaxID=3424130 RepID=UPI003D33D2A1
MTTTRSTDGTAIDFTRSGTGPAVVITGGALNDQAAMAPLADLLATRFTVYNYDRRGRGASGNTEPYQVERELEDLRHMIELAGGSAYVFANCSGGAIAIEGAARGFPVTKLAMYEPPFIIEGQRRKVEDRYRERLGRMLDEGRRGEAIRYFMSEAVEMPPETIARVGSSPAWEWLEGMAPSLRYDAEVMGDYRLPLGRMARITCPVLVMDGAASPDWARNTVQSLVDAAPRAQRESLDGQDHNLNADVVFPVLEKFLVS